MKKIYLLLSLAALLFGACGENDNDFTPSNGERNWLIVEDNPNDPIDHQRYLIFQETGIPIYYNDTIGSEERYSYATGDPYTYYEVLQVFYSPGNSTPGKQSARYVLPADREKVKPVLDFLETEILPKLSKDIYVPSILLVDTLVTPTGDDLAYKGTNTVVLSKVCDFADMDETTLKTYKGTFLATLVSNTLAEFEEEWLEENFYALTYSANPNYINKLYSTSTSGSGRVPLYQACAGLAEQSAAILGFVWLQNNDSSPKYVPTKAQDVLHFCIEIFAYTEAKFMSLHEGENLVLKKYRVMRNKLEEYGFTFE